MLRILPKILVTLMLTTVVAIAELGGTGAPVSAVPATQTASCLAGTWLADDPDAYGRVIGVAAEGAEGAVVVGQTGGSLTLTFGDDGTWQAAYEGYTAEVNVSGPGGGVMARRTLNGTVRGTYQADDSVITAQMTDASLTATREVVAGGPTGSIVIARPGAAEDLPVQLATDLGSVAYACEGDRLTLLSAPTAWYFLPFAYNRTSDAAAPAPPPADPEPPAEAPQATEACPGGPDVVDVIVIPENTVCRMDGWQIAGTIDVLSGATVVASGIRLDGTIHANGAATITIDQSEIVGTLESFDSREVAITNSRVTGRIGVAGAESVTLTGNEISGLVEVGAGSVHCDANTVTGVVNGCPE